MGPMRPTKRIRRGAISAVLLVAGSFLAYAQTGKRSELNGVWILLRSNTENLKLTPSGEKARASYDFQKDDPDMHCIPASFTRVMHTPSPPIEVRQHQDSVEINYEFMDVQRRVPLKKGLALKDAPYAARKYPHMGRSVGQYEGETLVIETAGQRAGVLDTLGVPGLYQSDQMRTIERFVANGNTMQVTVTHYDPVYYLEPLVVHYTYLRLPGGKILKWDCKPEEATFERFLPR
jgi:hypothetical protein